MPYQATLSTSGATAVGAFRTTVEVDPDQTVVTTGPYRWIRHPAYSGLLLVVAGFGLTTAGDASGPTRS